MVMLRQMEMCFSRQYSRRQVHQAAGYAIRLDGSLDADRLTGGDTLHRIENLK